MTEELCMKILENISEFTRANIKNIKEENSLLMSLN